MAPWLLLSFSDWFALIDAVRVFRRCWADYQRDLDKCNAAEHKEAVREFQEAWARCEQLGKSMSRGRRCKICRGT